MEENIIKKNTIEKESDENILNGVSESQKEGILHTKSPLLLLAGAGSGKTLVITRKIAYLINKLNVPPERIMALTFTNKAAKEMKHRVSSMLKDIKQHRLFIKTFHSAALRILKENAEYIGYKKDFTIIDEGDKLSAIKKLMKDDSFNIPKHINAKTVVRVISNTKNDLSREYIKMIPVDMEVYEAIYNAYCQYTVLENVMDFDDLILNTIILFEKEESILEYYRSRFKYILVDEFQDTNPIQYKFIKLLTENATNELTVVGDDDQSIYAFRGATVINILNFKRDYPDAYTVKLEENYRCPKDVVSAALSVIKNNTNRHDKNVFSNKKNEFKIENWVCDTDMDEAKAVVDEIEKLFDLSFEAKDIVILFRTNSQSRLYEKELLSHNISYRIVGGVGFFERTEIKDSIAFLRLMTGFNDNMSVRRTINTPPRSVGEKTISIFDSFAYEKHMSLYEAIDIIEESAVSKKAQKSIKDYKSVLSEYGCKMREDNANIEELFNNFLKTIDYFSIYKSEDSFRAVTAEDNIKELFRAYYDYRSTEIDASITGFLDDVILVRDTENQNEDSITLMTIHNAKGLEFDAVFLTGLEMGVFPHYFALEEEGGIDEERRLCYVGITRAKRRLYLTYSMRRKINMGIEYNKPSVFLKEIPSELMEVKNKESFISNCVDIDEDAFDY